MALILRDEGQLDLDRPAEDYLPVLRSAFPGRVRPSARMLLTMSAGLASDNQWADRQEAMPVPELEKLLCRGLPLAADPGTVFVYSNLGYALLGRIIEEISGAPYTEVVKKRLLAPLGLTETAFVASGLSRTAAPGHRRWDGEWLVEPFSGPGAFSPIGGLFSSVSDLCRWAGWLGSAFTAEPENPGVLGAASRREMQQARRRVPAERETLETAPQRSYGFGLFVEEIPGYGPVVSHSGGYPGFSSHMRWHPESGMFGVALENATYAEVHVPVNSVFNQLLATAGTVDGPLRPSVPEAPGGQPTTVSTVSPALITPWKSALKARKEVNTLLAGWDRSRAEAIFADNMVQDLSMEHRLAELAKLREATGALDLASAGDPVAESASRISWDIPGQHAILRCCLSMTPVRPELIQELRFTVQAPAGC